VRLADLLSHLYVLLPVLDDDKHYWVGEDEASKLLDKGGAWLAAHPAREVISRRYLKHRRSLADDVLARLADDAPAAPADGDDDERHDREEDQVEQPAGRTAFFVGDLVDRGPDSPGVLRLVMGMVRDGTAACVPGNHENKLGRVLAGRKVTVSHGLAETLAQLDAEPEPDEFRREVAGFIDGLVSHAVLDDGRCVVAHAGLPEGLHNRSSGAVRSFALYGDTTGETDEFGLPVRYPWANDYRGSAVVVYGHTPVPEAEWVNNTLCIDTGCVFGGKLTALRYPERDLVSVPAARTYWEPARPLDPAPTEADRPAELLDATDVLDKRIVDTRLQPRIAIGAENAAAAFEVISRFAIDPRWLVYLPPTMAPTAISTRLDLLEHPAETFAAYRRDGVARAICEETHMGSRAVVVVCRDADVAARRFKIDDPIGGTVYTRTGRAFFAETGTSTPTAATAGRSTPPTTCGSRRSWCSPRRARCWRAATTRGTWR
jgi:polynucleotide kinase-phosphatase